MLTPCRATASLSIILCISDGREETSPAREMPCSLALPEEALSKFSAQKDREGSQFQDPTRKPGMHRILVES